MKTNVTRDQALSLLMKYNKEPFHILHGLTVEGTMRWYAKELGYGEDEDFWGIAGLLHDVDFENYPEEHCIKAPELLAEAGAEPELIYDGTFSGAKTAGDGVTARLLKEHGIKVVGESGISSLISEISSDMMDDNIKITEE